MQFSERMEYFGESIFTRLRNLRQERESKGEVVIDLSIGTPNIPPADHIIAALVEAIQDKDNYIYAIADLPQLHDAVAMWYQKRYNVTIKAEEEVVSLLGSQEGLAHIAMTIVDPGDVVLVPNPCYPIFADGPVLAGAKLAYMPLRKENDYIIDFAEIDEDIADAAKLMIVSYPNNPTTAVAPDSFYEELIAFAKKYDIIVIHDNAYSELIFTADNEGKSFLSYQGAKEVGVEFNSLSKTYGLAGGRIGFCIGNSEIVAMLTKLKSNMDYGMFIPLQKAAIAAITGNQECVKATREAYRRRRDCFVTEFAKLGWKIEGCKATMFIWAKIPDNFATSADFVEAMITKAGVVITPGSAFGALGEGYVRVALVQDEEIIRAAARQVGCSGILD
jgi:Aspartate/tyrosine/aromatic aminotransferase